MRKKILKIILCKILTLGRHRWIYNGRVRCSICGKIPGNQWEIYKKKFLGKPSGKHQKPSRAERRYYKELSKFVREVLTPEAEKCLQITKRIINGGKND